MALFATVLNFRPRTVGMMRFLLLLAALGFTGLSASAAIGPVAPPDSIGVEYRNNKMLIKHRVTPGETLYGLSRRYKVPVEDIVGANPKLTGALISGQVVIVPRTRVVLTTPAATPKPTAPAIPAAARALATDAQGNRVYVVRPGQTLFSIAQRYGVATAELIRLNRLPAAGTVRAGQQLIMVPADASATKPSPAKSTTPAAAAKPTVPPPATPAPTPARSEETRSKDPLPSPSPAAPAPTPAPTEENEAPEHANEIVSRVSESGLAAVIDGASTEKYLALHKTAPVGTIMQVRNIMNGQSVYVRVIGKLPDTGENNSVLVRLSPRAVQKLATPDARFRVETSYVP